MNLPIEPISEFDGEASSLSLPKNYRRITFMVWVLIALSLSLTLVGIFFMRLWLAGWVVGVGALILALFSGRYNTAQADSSRAKLTASIAVVVLPMMIAAVSFSTAGVGIRSAPMLEDLDVEFIAEAQGGFFVQHTVPAEPGSDKSTVAQAEATDRFSYSFESGKMNSFQFQAAIDQSNLGPKEITCTVKIEGEVVLTRTGDNRHVNCSDTLRTLAGKSSN